MTAITPMMTKGTAGYVESKLGVYGGICALADNILTDTAQHLGNRLGLHLSIFFFDDVSNADTWGTATAGLKQVVACAWQGADPDDDGGAVSLLSVDSTKGHCQIGFAMQNANSEGWLWVLHGS